MKWRVRFVRICVTYHNVVPNAASIKVVTELGNFSVMESNSSNMEYCPSTNEFDSNVKLHNRNKTGIRACTVEMITPT